MGDFSVFSQIGLIRKPVLLARRSAELAPSITAQTFMTYTDVIDQ
jgi:hypothetical protein